LDLRELTSNERKGRRDGTEWQGEEKGKVRGGEEDGMGKHREGEGNGFAGSTSNCIRHTRMYEEAT